ncbi:MAG: hypothetical protein AAFN00_05135 [Cyanobacteria bacterium J06558_2]
MSWNNLALIVTNRDWQYTQSFVGNYIRVRHILGSSRDNLPYGFTGLFAQAFDLEGDLELFDIRRLYPSQMIDVFEVTNPFPNRPRRLAFRGQTKYQTAISWQVSIDFWTGQEAASFINDIDTKIEKLITENNNLSLTLDLILSKLDIQKEEPKIPPTTAQQNFFFLQ